MVIDLGPETQAIPLEQLSNKTFMAGLELGIIISRLRSRPRNFRDYVSNGNLETVEKLAAVCGYGVLKCRQIGQDHTFIYMRRKDKAA